MGVRGRLLAIRLLEKEKKNPDFFRELKVQTELKEKTTNKAKEVTNERIN